MRTHHEETTPLWPEQLKISLELWYQRTLLMITASIMVCLTGSVWYHITTALHAPQKTHAQTTATHETTPPELLTAQRNATCYNNTIRILNAIPDDVALTSYHLLDNGTLHLAGEAVDHAVIHHLIEMIQHNGYPLLTSLQIVPEGNLLRITLTATHDQNS